MDFGRVEDISKVDFTFPDDDKMTLSLFKEIKQRINAPEIFIGSTRWGNTGWIPKLYPKGTKTADYLSYYSQNFNAIELNAMFYRLFPKDTVRKWADIVSDDFRFCPKFSNVITHIKRMKKAEKETEAFLDTISALGTKLGTSFIQLDERFSPNQYEQIHQYLHQLPRHFDVAIEFRHPDWFQNHPITEDTFELMRELGITSVITDTSGRRDALHMKLSTPKAFIRFVGNSLHSTDFKRIDDWVERINLWLTSGLQTLYFFIHQPDELYTPELSSYLIERLNSRAGLHLQAPKLIHKFTSPSLFSES